MSELCRVTRGPIVILTFERDALERYWLAEYAPELIAVERRRYPTIETICSSLRGKVVVQVVPIPIDCVDGFTEAFYARPECFLEPEVLRVQSAWGFVDAEEQERFVKQLRPDLSSGAWDQRYGEWRRKPYFEGSLRLVVRMAAEPG